MSNLPPVFQQALQPFASALIETPEEREEFLRIPAFLKPGYRAPASAPKLPTYSELVQIIKRATPAPCDSDAVAELLLAE